MRRLLWSAFLALAVSTAAASTASAQTPLAPFAGGTPVGRPLLTNVGQAAPRVAPQVGTPIGFRGPDGQPISTEKPQGQVVDLKNLAAPLTAPLGPGLSNSPKSIFEQVYDRWRSAIGLSRPNTPSPAYTPGLSRRNRERRDSMWRWD